MKVRISDATSPIPDISNLDLIDRDEVDSFRVAKRVEEHASGRFLVAHLLRQIGENPEEYMIVRDEYRAPSLVGPTPMSVSITHSGGFCSAVIGPSTISFGLDLEVDSGRNRNLLPYMASGDELEKLESEWDNDPLSASSLTNQIWVMKEAVQKASGKGMGIPPQSFSVIDEISTTVDGLEYQILHWQLFPDSLPIDFALAYNCGGISSAEQFPHQ
ncbi:MAG: 4'-phosphopantetheinyl transferase superfamily protein [Euryarchaeota archaeon]|nr:4'-phosphopantetheinyl transferase superfamily protein [Euryarchaeota archaeon]